MRSLGLGVLFVLVGCRCSGVAPVEETESSAEPLVVPDGALCFRVDSPELFAVYDFEAAAKSAAAEWGRELILDDRCGSVFALDDLSVVGDGLHQVAVHRPWRSPEGVTAPAGRGGHSMILLDREAVMSGRLVDMPAAACDAEWVAGGEPRPLLSRALTHELGHALGVPDSDSQGGAMFWFGGMCLHIAPSDAEKSATVASGANDPE